jgi:hypothetical protein
MIIVGIDPGLTGGLAFITDKNLCQVYAMPTKKKESGGVGINTVKIARFLRTIQPDHVFIEEVMSFSGASNNHSIKVSSQNWGRIVGILELLDISYSIVDCRLWQKQLGVAKAVKGVKDVKDRIYARAQVIFPDVNFVPEGKTAFHDGMVDAAMIAKYGLNVLTKLT